jgi:hypothetical protein
MKSVEICNGCKYVCENFTTSIEVNHMGCESCGAGMSGLSEKQADWPPLLR